MNFKPNAWTLLFALALGAFLYQMNSSKADTTDTTTTEVTDDKSDPCDTVKVSPIPAEEAFNMLEGYTQYILENSEFMNKAKSEGILNPDVIYFKIPKCEFATMAESFPGGDVFAYLGLKPAETAGEYTIDLFFSDQTRTTTTTTDGEVLAAKGDGDEQFYDFTLPCPTTCPKED